jgi:hypothetical protein
MSRLSGTVQAEGAPVAGAAVLAAAMHEELILASAQTGDDGGFALEFDAARVRLLARAGAGEAVGLAFGIVDDASASHSVTLRLEDHAPLHPVTFLAEGDIPPELDLQLTPREIRGLDEDAISLFHAPVDGATQPMLVQRPLGETPQLRMQAGSWILYSALDSAPDALGANSKHVMWRIASATLESGEELEPAVIGYRLEVSGALTVRLRVVSSEQ